MDDSLDIPPPRPVPARPPAGGLTGEESLDLHPPAPAPASARRAQPAPHVPARPRLDAESDCATMAAGPRRAPAAPAEGMDSAPLTEGMELRGRYRYRLQQQLGRGGFGSVFLANCLDGGDGPGAPPPAVALKFFDVPTAGDQHVLVKRELSALLAMQHDRIIRLYDWRVERSPCFMALEYYPAGSLFDTDFYLGRPFELDSVVRVMADLLSALVAAHQASVLHLDIKPSNVLCDYFGSFVLTDFGISQGNLVGADVVATGIGSLGYQAPEQRDCDRTRIGPRTDLWGVGATAWSLYTGLRLDLHRHLIKPAGAANAHGLPPVSQFRPMRPEVEAIIMGLLATDPADRPGGAAEVLAALNAATGVLTDRATMRPPPPSAGRARAGLRLHDRPTPEIEPVVRGLLDPVWSAICKPVDCPYKFTRFEAGEIICEQDEDAYRSFVLLSGAVAVERDGVLLARETREGSFLGETATLTGECRTATIRADGPVWALVFNAAEFEQFVMAHPAVAIRLIKTLALRGRANSMTPAPATPAPRKH